MKRIVLTGDSGGLGYEIAKTLLEKPADEYFIIGLSRKINDNIIDLQKRYAKRYVHIDFDLSYPDKIKELYTKQLKQYGSLYGLVNNSAYAYDDIVSNAKVESLDKMFKINVVSAMVLTKYLIRDMLLYETKGSLVHISSVSAHTGYKGLSMYAATKGAMESFSKGVAREWGRKGIRSNCVAPGFMETKMSATLDEDTKQKIYKRTSVGVATDVLSVANTVEFLLSDKALAITGALIPVDCGTI